MSSARIPVNGAVLTWARETAGLDVSTSAQRISVKPERLIEWENEDSTPTLNQLRNLAKAYSRPLGALMMPEPPQEEARRAVLPDFRRPAQRREVDPRALQNAIVRARGQRDDLIEVSDLMSEDPASRSPRFRFMQSDGAEKIGAQLRKLLELDSVLKTQISRPEELLRSLIERVEALDVLVIQVQSVSADVMRGFSLAEEQFPVIALNGADWPRGKVFTLLHEMVHVGLRSSGLCDLRQESDQQIEKLCDAAAGAALMPKSKIVPLAVNLQRPLTINQMSALGTEFGASGEAATLRLVSLGKVTWDEYFELQPKFREAYQAHKDLEKANRDKDAPIYYQLKVRDLGRPFIRKVLRAYGEDVVSSRDLAVMLDVKFDKVPKLASLVGTI